MAIGDFLSIDLYGPFINFAIGLALGSDDSSADQNRGQWLDGIAHRLDTANAIAQNPANQERLDPKAMLETALGPLASADTRSVVNRAETKQQAVALLLMAPEFQRR